jgi:hypothetical protein
VTTSIRCLDAPIGAEIRGIDLAQSLASRMWTQSQMFGKSDLSSAFAHSGSLIHNFWPLAGISLDPPGPNPYREPCNKAFSEINVISTGLENARPMGNLGSGEAIWHAMPCGSTPLSRGLQFATISK